MNQPKMFVRQQGNPNLHRRKKVRYRNVQTRGFNESYFSENEENNFKTISSPLVDLSDHDSL